jgi:hypothetical protein
VGLRAYIGLDEVREIDVTAIAADRVLVYLDLVIDPTLATDTATVNSFPFGLSPVLPIRLVDYTVRFDNGTRLIIWTYDALTQTWTKVSDEAKR